MPPHLITSYPPQPPYPAFLFMITESSQDVLSIILSLVYFHRLRVQMEPVHEQDPFLILSDQKGFLRFWLLRSDTVA